MASYNGHRSWNAWNVSLWINNDEGLYTMAKEAIARSSNRYEAATTMLIWLRESGDTETPDGAPYAVTSIREAMVGM